MRWQALVRVWRSWTSCGLSADRMPTGAGLCMLWPAGSGTPTLPSPCVSTLMCSTTKPARQPPSSSDWCMKGAIPESQAGVAARCTRTTVARLMVHIASATMDGWQHTTLDFDPEADGDEARWAQKVALDGWRTWHASGVWVTVGNRYVRRWALRRPCARPWSAHDHASSCGQR